MQTYKVNHTGLVLTEDKEGKRTEHRFEKDVPVELSDEAAKALGDAAKPTREPVKDQSDELKKPLNKMVPGSQPR
jgi:hypothetical protein